MNAKGADDVPARLARWWGTLTPDDQARALALDPHGGVPPDLFTSLAAARVHLVETSNPGADNHVYWMSDALREFLDEKRQEQSGQGHPPAGP
ncbi:hypothetical protein ABZV60_19480 [Streptomyces sp. NPDC004787]|uniref:hypothetical protein n=1 Tax=Streptomyces sp. NPDC004787 TaxID=3154291 RepID=UPI0033B87E7A